MVGVALVYFVMSALVKWQGVRVIERLFPPVVIGPVIILIGLSLAGTGGNMAKENWVLALLSLVTAVVVSMKAKGLLKLIGGIMVAAGAVLVVVSYLDELKGLVEKGKALCCRCHRESDDWDE